MHLNIKKFKKPESAILGIIFAIALYFFFNTTLFSNVNTLYTKVFVKQSSCVGCSACVEVCPVKAIKIVNGKAVIDADSCIGCLQCLRTCNYDALYRNSAGGKTNEY